MNMYMNMNMNTKHKFNQYYDDIINAAEVYTLLNVRKFDWFTGFATLISKDHEDGRCYSIINQPDI